MTRGASPYAALCRISLPLHAAGWAALTVDMHGRPLEKRAMDRTPYLHLGSRIHILNLSIVVGHAMPGNGFGFGFEAL